MEAKIDLSPEGLRRLRDIARKATQGDAFPKWASEDDLLNANSNEVPLIPKEDYEHILANNPETVSAMIDEIENLRTQCAQLEREADWLAKGVARYWGRRANYGIQNQTVHPDYESVNYWREEARKAVEEQCKSN